MFDTMTSTKILGAVCGALLLFLFAKWGADALTPLAAVMARTAKSMLRAT